MSNEQPVDREAEASSFADVLKQFEQSHAPKQVTSEGREATVIAISGDLVFLDVGLKTEGALPASLFREPSDGEEATTPLTVKIGDKMQVSITGHDPQGFYNLSLIKFERPKDWSALEKAFADKAT